VFGSVVAVAFQIAFRAEIHANDFFYFLKIIFDISISKRSKKYKPHSILAKKKIFKIWRNAVANALPNSETITCHSRQNHIKHKSIDSQKFDIQYKLIFQIVAGNIGKPESDIINNWLANFIIITEAYNKQL